MNVQLFAEVTLSELLAFMQWLCSLSEDKFLCKISEILNTNLTTADELSNFSILLLLQYKAIPSCPISCYLGKKATHAQPDKDISWSLPRRLDLIGLLRNRRKCLAQNMKHVTIPRLSSVYRALY